MLGLVLSGVVAASACGEDEQRTHPPLPAVRMVEAFPRLKFERPVWMEAPPGDPHRFFVVEQGGAIRVFENSREADSSKLVLDLSDKILAYNSEGHNEEGLLAFAFHPKFEENGYFFVYYTAARPRRGVLSRFKVSDEDPDRADPASEQTFLIVEQPFGNHNGSTVLFGPDGYLYASFGDGGSANDPFGHGQNLGTLLGTVIRIDVDTPRREEMYSIPKDNPFRGRKDARPEIWAYGLRNVWRMSFDRQTGELWGGDIGQNKWEEIVMIVPGGNYGWNIMEGFHPFLGGRAADALNEPVIEYGRELGVSVTGGYVYRGKRLKNLIGAYIYADYVSGRIWALRQEFGRPAAHKEILHQPKNIASFAEGPDGELYLLVFDGKIYELEEE
jgi:glucose/arabinose dehydrogenase